MSWMQKLYQTYESVQNQGLDDEDLALPFHMPKAVHLKVVLDDRGELVSAKRFDGRKQVPIQVTEKSSKRSGSTIAAYALHDGLQYIAKTAGQYLTVEYLSKVAEKDGGKKWKKFLSDSDAEKQKFINTEKLKYQNCFQFYEKQLSDWVEESNLREIQIVLQYIQQGSLIEDLLEKKVLSFENNILLSGQDDPFDFTIVWAVQMMPSDVHADLWSKSSIQNQWIKYQESQKGQESRQKELCYITGEQDYPTDAFPKIDGNAKLVSANDTVGFTFRGRFLTDKQAIVLGREVSQKASNILKWLIKRQGIKNGDQFIVAWSINCSEEDKTLSLLYATDDIYAALFSEDNVNQSADLGLKAAELIRKKLYGYQAKLKANEQISLLMLEKSTDGRMALIYYQEFLPADYFNNLDEWIDDFSWYQSYKPKEGKPWLFTAPSLERIAETVLTKSELEDKKKRAKKQLYSRLLPVIAGGCEIPIPYDFVQKSFQTACNPFAQYQSKDGESKRKINWEKNIGVACALYKGWRARHDKSSQWRNYPMALDKENRSRDYLFGRLLAVAEELENMALRMAKEERATNAERYMQRFATHPLSTWKQLELSLEPYKNRLRKNYPVKITAKFTLENPIGFLKNRETEITELVNALDELQQNTDCILDKPLDGEFLLGYHSQKMAYRNKSNAQSMQDGQNEIEFN